MEKKTNYTIGLDIGTDSVGWAVVKDDLELVKKRMKVLGNTETNYIKKNLWGSLLFESGQTAKDRRLKRVARRRYERRRNRLTELQKIFASAIDEVDENFFFRLNESFLVPEDKAFSKNPIFGTLGEDKTYYNTYPTIYHLRQHLADSEEKADVRLIYLALAHMIKYRGHFLIEGKLDTEHIAINDNLEQFFESYNALFPEEPVELRKEELVAIENILREKNSRTVKEKRVTNFLKDIRGANKQSPIMAFITFIVGKNAKFKAVFNLEEDISLNLTDDSYEENLEILLNSIGSDFADLFDHAQRVYNAVELAGILSGDVKNTHAKLSAQMVAMYERHKEQLKEYKAFIKAKLPDQYDMTFVAPKDAQKKDLKGYAGYIDGKLSQDDFYKFVKDQLKEVPGSEKFLDMIEKEDFLRKQRSFYNGVIPNQVHLAEMEAILGRQENYYPWLKENREKILSLLTFRIPYYVGPLADGQSEFAWLERKSDEKIKPWNFSDVVDLDRSAEKFIEQLIGRDTYLPDEYVLPKKSLIYQKYMVFNELTKIAYLDERQKRMNLSSVEKKEIFETLFKKRSKVTKKQLVKFFENHLQIDNPTIFGIEDAFNADYSTYVELEKVPGMKSIMDDPENEDLMEEIVKILTVFEDRKMRRKQLENHVDQLSQEQIKELAKKHYTGWGRLSKKLLVGIRDKDSQKTILEYLVEDDNHSGGRQHLNRNLMQLINDDRLSFKKTIAELQVIDPSADLYAQVQEIAGSPAIKKGILLGLKIVDEIIRVMGEKPENIVIEMARENQTTARGKALSKRREAKIKEGLAALGSSLLKENPPGNADLTQRKIYLYYAQNGKDIYLGEPLDFDRLSQYDEDHIIPQSFTVDNSLDNLVLTNSSQNRGNKKDDVPSPEVVNKQLAYWRSLKDAGLMSQRKFDNLTKAMRGGLTEKDREHFIQRQLVETRQITKNVAKLLDMRLNDKKDEAGNKIRETNIVLLKSAMASEFRKMFRLYKVREINDYHHAHDAYLNAAIAINLLALYPYMADDFVYGEFRYKKKPQAERATYEKLRQWNLIKRFGEDLLYTPNREDRWNKERDIKTIKKVMGYRQVNVVKKAEENTGEIFGSTLKPRGSGKTLIPIKRELDVDKYGGYEKTNPAYYVIARYLSAKGKKEKDIIPILIMDKSKFEENPKEFLEDLKYEKAEILGKIKNYTLVLFEDGSKRFISGKDELRKANQLVLDQTLVNFIYHLKHYDDMNNPESAEYVESHRYMFDELLNTILSFASVYLLSSSRKPKLFSRLKSRYEEEKDKAELSVLATSFIELLKLPKADVVVSFEFLGEQEKMRYRDISKIKNGTIIYQSLTGLYETRMKFED